MPTIIHFVGRDQIMVREAEEEVQAAFDASGGAPAALTHHRTGRAVFVNLGQVTYWQGRATRDVLPLSWSPGERFAASR